VSLPFGNGLGLKQGRFMNRILIAFVAGVSLFQLFTKLPSLAWITLLLPLLWLWRTPWMRPLIGFFAGLCWSLLSASAHLSHQLPLSLEGKDLLVEGVVDSLPQQRGKLIQFRLRVTQLTDDQGEAVDLDLVRLNWYRTRHVIEPGQVWRLMVRLKRPRGMQNPAGFDYEQWLFSQGIQATGYVRAWKGSRLLSEAAVGSGLDRLRHAIALSIDERFGSGISGALVKALTIGDRRGLSAQQWRVFTLTGTNHLIAISGLHVGLVAGWLLFLGQWCWRRSEYLTLRLPALRAGALLGLCGALIYAALAGFSLPTQRALIMLSIALGGLILGRQASPARSLSLALFAIVVCDPLAPLSVGFWLSFGAVALILVSVAGRVAGAKAGHQLLRVQWGITLGLMPLLLLFFGEASSLSPLVNLLMVPWFALVLVPMALIGLPLLAWPALAALWTPLMAALANYTYDFLSWSSTLPIPPVQFAHLPAWCWLPVIAGGLLMLLPAGLPGRPIGLLMVLPVIFIPPARPTPGEYWFTLLDVGQGLACVVETTNHLLVYDTGPAYASGFSAAESALLPYLTVGGYERIDRLVLSNNDQDHAGGLKTVRAALPVDDLISGEAQEIDVARPCLAGEHWDWDGVSFTILHPHGADGFAQANDRSCVLSVSNGDWTLLLPGDVEAHAEAELLARYGEELSAQIVVAPHHGSNTSSAEAFVDAVHPQWVIFSTGYRNQYGFPRTEVVDRWRARGAQTLDSAQDGAVQLRLPKGETSSSLEPLRYRRLKARYWSQAP
jgi:competence protein ComEC